MANLAQKRSPAPSLAKNVFVTLIENQVDQWRSYLVQRLEKFSAVWLLLCLFPLFSPSLNFFGCLAAFLLLVYYDPVGDVRIQDRGRQKR